MRTMRTGIHVANFTWRGGPADMGPRLAELGAVSEEVGCSRLSCSDDPAAEVKRWEPLVQRLSDL